MAKRKLILATANEHKVREMRALLAGCGWELAASPPGVADVPESGSTFAENARIKAIAVARATGEVALADDSGLMVDALGGEPGVHSKRWAGDTASDADRIRKLLEALSRVETNDRTARFVCSACIAAPDEVLWESEGRVDGVIAERPSGEGGFGYDPIFYIPASGSTMAGLTAEQKNAVSHRGRVMALAARWLQLNAGQ